MLDAIADSATVSPENTKSSGAARGIATVSDEGIADSSLGDTSLVMIVGAFTSEAVIDAFPMVIVGA
jgi:hypothetical protein